MRNSGAWLLSLPVLAAIVLAGWAIIAASPAGAASFNVLLYLLANLVVMVDILDFAVRMYLGRIETYGSETRGQTSVALDTQALTPQQKRIHVRPYAIVVSVCNAEDHLDDFLEEMRPYRDRVWVIDDGSTDNTIVRLRQAGWRCIEGEVNRKKPGAIRVLLDKLPAEIETVMVTDPDIRIRNSGESASLDEILFDFQRSGMAAMCPRVAVKEDGFLARFQSLEYCIGFSLGRRSLGDCSITSGVALYRRRALEDVMRQHSLSVYAEDLENALILLGAGHRIYYDGRLLVETAGKRHFRAWFSQRVGWFYGLIRVYLERVGDVRRAGARRFIAAYHYLVYIGIFCLLLHPLKLVGLALLILSLANGLDGLLGLNIVPDTSLTHPAYFLAVFAKYLAFCLVAFYTVVPRQERLHVLPAVPLYVFYVLAQLLPIAVGYVNWFTLKLWSRRIYRDHYEDEGSLLPQKRRLANSPMEA